MSNKAVDWAFDVQMDHLPTGAKFALVALADNADDYGVVYIGQARVAAKCSCSRETASRNMKVLERAGLIARVERRAGNGRRTSDFTVLAPLRDRGRMLDCPPTEHTEAVAGMARSTSCDDSSRDVLPPLHVTFSGGQEPSVEPSPLRGSLEGARERTRGRRVRYKGRDVPVVIAEAAESLLLRFAESQGRTIGARTSSGDPSPPLKRVVGVLLARPDVTVDQWQAAIANTVANPPGWLDGRALQVGDIFGERSADHALANTGRAAPSAGRVSSKAASLARRRADLQQAVNAEVARRGAPLQLGDGA